MIDIFAMAYFKTWEQIEVAFLVVSHNIVMKTIV